MLLANSAALDEHRLCHRPQPGRGQKRSTVLNRFIFQPVDQPSPPRRERLLCKIAPPNRAMLRGLPPLNPYGMLPTPKGRVHWLLTRELSAVSLLESEQTLCQHIWPKNLLPPVQKQSWPSFAKTTRQPKRKSKRWVTSSREPFKSAYTAAENPPVVV